MDWRAAHDDNMEFSIFAKNFDCMSSFGVSFIALTIFTTVSTIFDKDFDELTIFMLPHGANSCNLSQICRRLPLAGLLCTITNEFLKFPLKSTNELRMSSKSSASSGCSAISTANEGRSDGNLHNE